MPSSAASGDRLGSRGSGHTRPSASGHHSSIHGHRSSVSPTEFFQARINKADQLEDRVYEMNAFIYKGIDKFLDKQAVRDLIDEYDREDLYGEEGLEAAHFSRGLDSDSEDEEELRRLETLLATEKANALKALEKKLANPQPGVRRVRGPRSSLMDTFMGLIKVKLFNVHRRSRRDINRDIEGLGGPFADPQPETTSICCFG